MISTLTLATFSTTPQWLALPFCDNVESLPHDSNIDDGGGARMVRKACTRQLIGGFGLAESDQAELRRLLMCGCC